MFKEKFLPLEMVQEITKYAPSIWSILDDLAKNPSWDSKCYIPTNIVLSHINELDVFEDQKQAKKMAQELSALSAWRKNKQVFRFNRDFQDIFSLYSDVNLTSEILLYLPYSAFYVQFAKTEEIDPDKMDGVFVHYDWNNGELTLRFLFVYQTSETYGDEISLGKGMILNALDDIKELNSEYIRNFKKDDLKSIIISNLLQLILPFVFYICAQNADISVSKEQQTIYRKPSKIKDKFSEVCIWDVGAQIGHQIKDNQIKWQQNFDSQNQNENNAFWNCFRSDSEDGESKPILEWIVPSFIDNSNTE